MSPAAFCGIFELICGVPARVKDKAVAVYRIIERRKIAATNVHVIHVQIN